MPAALREAGGGRGGGQPTFSRQKSFSEPGWPSPSQVAAGRTRTQRAAYNAAILHSRKEDMCMCVGVRGTHTYACTHISRPDIIRTYPSG